MNAWTTELPTEAGYYWLRPIGRKARPVTVTKGRYRGCDMQRARDVKRAPEGALWARAEVPA